MKLLRHVKLNVKCELLFEIIKRVEALSDNKKLPCWKKRTDDQREEFITEDPEEEPIA